jgi:hypothetical protein
MYPLRRAMRRIGGVSNFHGSAVFRFVFIQDEKFLHKDKKIKSSAVVPLPQENQLKRLNAPAAAHAYPWYGST